MFFKINYLLVILVLMCSCNTKSGQEVPIQKVPIPDISISELEPHWSRWKEYNYKGESGMFCTKGSMGFMIGTMDFISYDANGMQVPPTVPGSTFSFETEDCEIVWINDLRISAHETLVFDITAKGLYYVSGKGKIVFKDGRSIEF